MTLYILYNTNHVVNQFSPYRTMCAIHLLVPSKFLATKCSSAAKKQDIKNLEVKVESQMNALIEHSAKVVKVQANEVIFDISPCNMHKVYLVLRFTKNEAEPLESYATQYNKALSGPSGVPWFGYAAPDLYSGLLTSEVVRHICLNEDLLSVTIPYIPDNLKDCMIMDTIQSLSTGGNDNPVGSNVKVYIMVKDPRGERPHVQKYSSLHRAEQHLSTKFQVLRRGKASS